MADYPVLFSFRRCPYAMRARMALLVSQTKFELIEVDLKNKPKEMLAISPKGTVPVLCLPDGKVIEQSLEIMHWALAYNDPEHWLPLEQYREISAEMIRKNDEEFKKVLDQYKYPERYPDVIDAKGKGEAFFSLLENHLQSHSFLFSNAVSITDIAIFPFVRQFAKVDFEWFENSSYKQLQLWLHNLENSSLFQQCMTK